MEEYEEFTEEETNLLLQIHESFRTMLAVKEQSKYCWQEITKQFNNETDSEERSMKELLQKFNRIVIKFKYLVQSKRVGGKLPEFKYWDWCVKNLRIDTLDETDELMDSDDYADFSCDLDVETASTSKPKIVNPTPKTIIKSQRKRQTKPSNISSVTYFDPEDGLVLLDVCRKYIIPYVPSNSKLTSRAVWTQVTKEFNSIIDTDYTVKQVYSKYTNSLKTYRKIKRLNLSPERFPFWDWFECYYPQDTTTPATIKPKHKKQIGKRTYQSEDDSILEYSSTDETEKIGEFTQKQSLLLLRLWLKYLKKSSDGQNLHKELKKKMYDEYIKLTKIDLAPAKVWNKLANMKKAYYAIKRGEQPSRNFPFYEWCLENFPEKVKLRPKRKTARNEEYMDKNDNDSDNLEEVLTNDENVEESMDYEDDNENNEEHLTDDGSKNEILVDIKVEENRNEQRGSFENSYLDFSEKVSVEYDKMIEKGFKGVEIETVNSGQKRKKKMDLLYQDPLNGSYMDDFGFGNGRMSLQNNQIHDQSSVTNEFLLKKLLEIQEENRKHHLDTTTQINELKDENQKLLKTQYVMLKEIVRLRNEIRTVSAENRKVANDNQISGTSVRNAEFPLPCATEEDFLDLEKKITTDPQVEAFVTHKFESTPLTEDPKFFVYRNMERLVKDKVTTRMTWTGERSWMIHLKNSQSMRLLKAVVLKLYRNTCNENMFGELVVRWLNFRKEKMRNPEAMPTVRTIPPQIQQPTHDQSQHNYFKPANEQMYDAADLIEEEYLQDDEQA